MSNAQNKVREAAIREWRSTPALQAEFSSPEVYASFRAAMARGSARLSPATTLHFKNPAARSSVGASEPSPDAMSVLDAMNEFKRGRHSYYRTELVAHVASRTGMSEQAASEAIKDTVV